MASEDQIGKMRRKVLNEFRKRNGLPPVERKILRCLKCNKKFKSRDKRSNRICDFCRDNIEQKGWGN